MNLSEENKEKESKINKILIEKFEEIESVISLIFNPAYYGFCLKEYEKNINRWNEVDKEVNDIMKMLEGKTYVEVFLVLYLALLSAGVSFIESKKLEEMRNIMEDYIK